MKGRPRKYVTIEELDGKFNDLQCNHFATLQKTCEVLKKDVDWLKTRMWWVLGVFVVLVPLMIAIIVEMIRT